MLTRRQIRVKVMQTIYAHFNGNLLSLKEGSKAIKDSCNDMATLYITLLGLFKALWEFAEEQHQIQSALRKSENPINPNFLIIKNIQPLALLAKHPFLIKKMAEHKITLWELEFDFIRHMFDKITASEIFTAFAAIEQPNFKKQNKFLIQIFKEILAPDERLYRYIEDLNIHWVDDLPVVNTFLLKQLRKLREDDLSSLNFPNLVERVADIDFGVSLYEKVISNHELLEKEFEGKTPNWDPERIAVLDSLLIKIAIAELFYFNEIPPKVTLNEYLEIAKEYSTPKSNQFINGVLDSLVKDYVQNNRLNKEGRGLLE
ncbi:MAG: transcription antitermination protein NusB [Flavobacteriaceae bacterium]